MSPATPPFRQVLQKLSRLDAIKHLKRRKTSEMRGVYAETEHGAQIPNFVYEPLHDMDSIRIVEVLPDTSHGRLQLRLRHEQMPVRYRCLSYMWGSSSASRGILINDQLCQIGDNLHHFLETARRLYPFQPLWVDALCINQNDLIEKGHQVQRMGQIYRGANEVLIWLGVDLELDEVFDVAHDPSTWDRLPPTVPKGLERLCRHPYWYRSWITQEILLAAHVRVLYKCHDVTWRHLGDLLSKSPGHALTLYDVTLSIFWKKTTRRTSDRIGNQTTVSQSNGSKKPDGGNQNAAGSDTLWSLLGWRTTPTCADLRDRIYALLALVDDGDAFEVDYNETVSSLFWRAGEFFQAWSDLYFISLLSTSLEISAMALKYDIEQRMPFHISYSVHQIFQPNDWARFDSEMTRKHCIHLFEERETTDILLCMHAKEVWGKGPHALLHPTPNGSFEVLCIPAVPQNTHTSSRPRRLKQTDVLHWDSRAWNALESLAVLGNDRRPSGTSPRLLPYRVQVPAEWMLQSFEAL